MAQENKFIQSLKKNAQLGKLVALEELYEINLNSIYTLILRLAGNKSLAELITKNTLVTAWKEIKVNGPDDLTFSEWLKNIAVKIAIDELRSSPDPERKINAKDDQPEDPPSEGLEQAIADLDNESRIILVLNKIENKSFLNISQLLSKTESDIEKKLSDAIARISNSTTNAESSTNINELLATIPKELEGDIVVLQSALVEKKLSDAIARISNSTTNAESSTNINELPATMPNELEADIEVLQNALDEIMEIRFEEIQESKDEIDAEELKEFRQHEERKKEERRKEAEERKKENKASKLLKELKINKKKVLRIALPIVILVFLVYFFTSTATWKASSTSGNPLLNKVPFTSFVDINPDDLITTDDISTAIVEIPDVGKINLLNGTSFKRLKKNNSCELLYGSVSIKAKGIKRNLSVVVPEAIVENFNSNAKYSIRTDTRGNTDIELEAGWLRVISGNNQTIFPGRYNLKILRGSGASLPYYSGSEFELIALLEEYLFGGKRGTTLNRILASSTEKENITLWNLIRRVTPEQKGAVYDKLYELVPHPDNIAKKEILNLDQDALQGWLEEIKW